MAQDKIRALSTGHRYSMTSGVQGLDGGVGIAFGSKWRGRFFAEARYVHGFSGAGYHAPENAGPSAARIVTTWTVVQ
jgi:hypothetical protein